MRAQIYRQISTGWRIIPISKYCPICVKKGKGAERSQTGASAGAGNEEEGDVLHSCRLKAESYEGCPCGVSLHSCTETSLKSPNTSAVSFGKFSLHFGIK